MWLLFASTIVEHQNFPSGSLSEVHASCWMEFNTNGKMQGSSLTEPSLLDVLKHFWLSAICERTNKTVNILSSIVVVVVDVVVLLRSPIQLRFEWSRLQEAETWVSNSVTRKKCSNVYKSCPKMISLEKW